MGASEATSGPEARFCNVQLFANVRLGPLLGKGGYAKVLRGTWNDKTVAVKVRRLVHSL